MQRDMKTLGMLLAAFSIVLVVVLSFVKITTDAQATLICENFHEAGTDMSQCPAHQSNVSWLILSAFGIAFVMLGTGLYMVFMPRQAEAQAREFKEIDFSQLSEEERKAYESIKGKGGSLYQSDLIKETGFSKVKITRVLDRMELKGILERKRRGMTNIIVLK